MISFPHAPRTLLAALALAASPASAQSFRLVDPTLTVDGRRVGVVGAPLAQESFGALTLSVPGSGTYRVAAQAFDGARSVGQFDGDGLFFAVDGRSVRLRSSEPILDRTAPTAAFVRFDPAGAPHDARRAQGLARVAVAPGVLDPVRRGPTAPDRTERRVEIRTETRAERRLDSGDRAEAARLRRDLDRVMAERDRLRAERDRLGAPRRGTGEPSADATHALADATAERDRLLAERDQIAAARTQAEADRERLAADFDDARRRAAAADTDRLRADLVARDRTLVALQAESADRAARLVAAEADLTTARRALYVALADRDRALAVRDGAVSARNAAIAERDAAAAERDALRASRPAPDVQIDDRAQLLNRLAAVQAERDALALQVGVLQSERDALQARIGRTAAERTPERARELPATRDTPSAEAPSAEAPRAGSSVVSLPGFDVGRLQNFDLIRQRLDEAPYPAAAAEGRIAGDVLVLFQTDPGGRVIRTAVASPIGGGLDGFAEALVREMVFVPPVVGGLPTGLRSQVVVRFER